MPFFDDRVFGREGKFLAFLHKIFGFEKHLQLEKIDFNESWLHFLLSNKILPCIIIFNHVFKGISDPLLALLFAQKIEERDMYGIIIVVFLFILIRLINHGLFYFDIVYRVTKTQSVVVSSYEYLLKCDPIYHTSRSSGQIISKIQRASKRMKEIIDKISFDIITTISTFIGLVIGFMGLWCLEQV